jgi:hypothetical protein
MWDLTDSLLGGDLVAASSPNVHAEWTDQPILPWRASSARTHDRTEQWRESDSRAVQATWKDALTAGRELHLPAWWIEPQGLTNPPPPLGPPTPQAGAVTFGGLAGWTAAHGATTIPPTIHPVNNIPVAHNDDMVVIDDTNEEDDSLGESESMVGTSTNDAAPQDLHQPSFRSTSRLTQWSDNLLQGRTQILRSRMHGSLLALRPHASSSASPSATTNANPSSLATQSSTPLSSSMAQATSRLPGSAPAEQGTASAQTSIPDELETTRRMFFRPRQPSMQLNPSPVTQNPLPDVDTPAITTSSDSVPPTPGFYRTGQIAVQSALGTSTSHSAVAVDNAPGSNQAGTSLGSKPIANEDTPSTGGPTGPASVAAPIDELQVNRMDHIHPSEEEISLHGSSWYIHRRMAASNPTVPSPRQRCSSTNRNRGDDSDTEIALPDGPGARGFDLAHECRQLLLNLLETAWSPQLHALSFVAHDPVASLVVRDPRLAFWIRVDVPHIRVHLPRGVNSLAIFKSSKEIALERRRALRGGASENDDAAGHHLNPNTMTDHTDIEDRIVGGDGSGGDLVSDQTRLFEIEVNTLKEMALDQEWARAGGQMPPQVCRILVGAKDREWRDVMVGERDPMTSKANANTIGPSDFGSSFVPTEDQRPASPSSSLFLSPSLSFVDLDDDEISHGYGDTDGDDLGECYDVEAAREQRRKMRAE